MRPHRLVAQDIGLSRRKRGFESPWGRQFSKCCILYDRYGMSLCRWHQVNIKKILKLGIICLII